MGRKPQRVPKPAPKKAPQISIHRPPQVVTEPIQAIEQIGPEGTLNTIRLIEQIAPYYDTAGGVENALRRARAALKDSSDAEYRSYFPIYNPRGYKTNQTLIPVERADKRLGGEFLPDGFKTQIVKNNQVVDHVADGDQLLIADHLRGRDLTDAVAHEATHGALLRSILGDRTFEDARAKRGYFSQQFVSDSLIGRNPVIAQTPIKGQVVAAVPRNDGGFEPIVVDTADFQYTTRPIELDPRLAQIRRLSAQISGKDIKTPDDASKLLNRMAEDRDFSTAVGLEDSEADYIGMLSPKWQRFMSRRMIEVPAAAAVIAASGQESEAAPKPGMSRRDFLKRTGAAAATAATAPSLAKAVDTPSSFAAGSLPAGMKLPPALASGFRPPLGGEIVAMNGDAIYWGGMADSGHLSHASLADMEATKKILERARDAIGSAPQGQPSYFNHLTGQWHTRAYVPVAENTWETPFLKAGQLPPEGMGQLQVEEFLPEDFGLFRQFDGSLTKVGLPFKGDTGIPGKARNQIDSLQYDWRADQHESARFLQEQAKSGNKEAQQHFLDSARELGLSPGGRFEQQRPMGDPDNPITGTIAPPVGDEPGPRNKRDARSIRALVAALAAAGASQANAAEPTPQPNPVDEFTRDQPATGKVVGDAQTMTGITADQSQRVFGRKDGDTVRYEAAIKDVLIRRMVPWVKSMPQHPGMDNVANAVEAIRGRPTTPEGQALAEQFLDHMQSVSYGGQNAPDASVSQSEYGRWQREGGGDVRSLWGEGAIGRVTPGGAQMFENQRDYDLLRAFSKGRHNPGNEGFFPVLAAGMGEMFDPSGDTTKLYNARLKTGPEGKIEEAMYWWDQSNPTRDAMAGSPARYKDGIQGSRYPGLSPLTSDGFNQTVSNSDNPVGAWFTAGELAARGPFATAFTRPGELIRSAKQAYDQATVNQWSGRPTPIMPDADPVLGYDAMVSNDQARQFQQKAASARAPKVFQALGMRPRYLNQAEEMGVHMPGDILADLGTGAGVVGKATKLAAKSATTAGKLTALPRSAAWYATSGLKEELPSESLLGAALSQSQQPADRTVSAFEPEPYNPNVTLGGEAIAADDPRYDEAWRAGQKEQQRRLSRVRDAARMYRGSK